MYFSNNSNISYKNIEYGSESVDVTLQCCNYLKENNYYQNSKEANFNLLERALINYSIIKFIDFGINISKINNINWDSLSEILEELNKYIPTEEDKKGFFRQYNHCIIYIHSTIQKKQPIKLDLDNDTSSYDLDNLTLITLDKNLPEYQKTLEILNIIKNIYKKNPILIK